MIVEARPCESIAIRAADRGEGPDTVWVLRFRVDTVDLPAGMVLVEGCRPIKVCLAVWDPNALRWRWASAGPILMDVILRHVDAGNAKPGEWYDGLIIGGVGRLNTEGEPCDES